MGNKSNLQELEIYQNNGMFEFKLPTADELA